MRIAQTLSQAHLNQGKNDDNRKKNTLWQLGNPLDRHVVYIIANLSPTIDPSGLIHLVLRIVGFARNPQVEGILANPTTS
jgi:hypothetical protein